MREREVLEPQSFRHVGRFSLLLTMNRCATSIAVHRPIAAA